jgi:hypothetical protein
MQLSELERMLYDSLYENDYLFLTAGLENQHGDDEAVYTPYSNVLPVGEAVFTPSHPIVEVEPSWEQIYHVRLQPRRERCESTGLNAALYHARFSEHADGYHPSFEERKEGVDSTWVEFPFVWYDVDDTENDALVKMTLYPNKLCSRYSMQRGIATAKN